jgi:hypothetical protein
MAKNSKPRKEQVVALPIEWHYPEGLLGRYANHAQVQFTEYECNISFFDLKPPSLTGAPAEQKSQLEKMRSVRAECVARIIVNPDRVQAIIAALQGAVKMREEMRSRSIESGSK